MQIGSIPPHDASARAVQTTPPQGTPPTAVGPRNEHDRDIDAPTAQDDNGSSGKQVNVVA